MIVINFNFEDSLSFKQICYVVRTSYIQSSGFDFFPLSFRFSATRIHEPSSSLIAIGRTHTKTINLLLIVRRAKSSPPKWNR